MKMHPDMKKAIEAENTRLLLYVPLPVGHQAPLFDLDPGNGVAHAEVAKAIGLGIASLMNVAKQLAQNTNAPADYLLEVSTWANAEASEIRMELHEPTSPESERRRMP